MAPRPRGRDPLREIHTRFVDLSAVLLKWLADLDDVRSQIGRSVFMSSFVSTTVALMRCKQRQKRALADAYQAVGALAVCPYGQKIRTAQQPSKVDRR